MTKTLLRGRVLSFHADPAETADSHRFWENGAILVEDGRILAVGDYADTRDPEAREIDHRPHIIMAGFIDPHIHFPQVQVVAAWAAQLLDWLNDHTFPIEAQYRDPAHAARMAEAFLDQLLLNGTTTASAFCSVHRESAEALFTAAEVRGMAMLAGKVMMDRNAPDAVLDTAQASYDDSRALIDRWHGRGRLEYVITPRFAITSTPGQLRAAGTLAAENPGLAVQTHLNENRAEIELTMQLYPEAQDYLDIYGPTSNLFLGSGLFDDRGMRDAGIVTGVATDIGGGTSWSMLATLAEAYKIAQMRGQRMHPLAAFHWATRGNAMALGIEDRVGSVQPGRFADLVVLDPRATQAMRLRHDKVDSLMQELFILQVMGDDRAVVETYVAGRPMKTGMRPAN